MGSRVSHRACEVCEKCVGSAPPTCRDLFLTLIMRLPISAQLRSAARDLGMLPEIAMASRMRSKLDFVGARGQLERASEVVSGVPMPEMQLLSGGALARMLRETGQMRQEVSLWDGIVERCGDAHAVVRIHALHGAITSHLHSGSGDAALQYCSVADALLPSADEMAFSGMPWDAVFATHRAQARVITGNALTPSDVVQVETTPVAAESIRLLIGDSLLDGGDTDGAVSQWEAVVPSGSADADLSDGDARPTDATMREIAARHRLGAVLRERGDIAASRAHLTEAADLCELLTDGGEDGVPASNPLLSYTLGELAASVAADGEFVAAEGLYRAAIDGIGGGGVAVTGIPPLHAPYLFPSLITFAELLERLETNGKPRVAEATQMRQRAADIRSAHADMVPAEGAALPLARGAWPGVQPWYVASLEMDWLGACLEGNA